MQSLLCAGQRRTVRFGAGRLSAEVLLPARGAHRLHLRGGRRGARAARHDRGAGIVRDVRDPRVRDRAARHRPVRFLAHDRLHAADRDSGVHQHRGRYVVVAGDRRSAAVYLVRRHIADREPRRACHQRRAPRPPGARVVFKVAFNGGAVATYTGAGDRRRDPRGVRCGLLRAAFLGTDGLEAL